MIRVDESIRFLDMPNFKPVYAENTEYGYYGKKGNVLKELLLENSEYHCMYCFASLKGDRKDLGELEHSIEKTLSDYLVECVPNMAVACSNCNQSLKRAGEKRRKERMKPYVKQYETGLLCKGTKCKALCDAYAELRKQYLKLNQLNLQPYGMFGEISGEEYRLQYDIMKAEFIPSKKYHYDKNDVKILEYHINQFKLNDVNYKTEALMDFIEDTIETDGRFSKHKNRYSNYIVDLFVDKIKRYSAADVLKICEEIYISYQRHHIIRRK